MKALSIRPPWAHAIAHLGKRIENRTWRTHYRGLVLIHASSTMNASDVAALEKVIGRPIGHDFTRGAIVAVAEIVDCVDASSAPGRWTCGPIAWVLRDVRALDTPVETPGALGLWNPSRELLRRVRAAL